MLLDGGGISSDQYQSAVAVLEQTGATVPATTTTLPPQVTNPVLPTLPLHGHHHRHGGMLWQPELDYTWAWKTNISATEPAAIENLTQYDNTPQFWYLNK